MINKEDKEMVNELKELRDALYNSLPKEKQKLADEAEIKQGANKMIELINSMNSASAYCIIESFLEANPKLILDVVGFSNLLADMFDVFGAKKVSNMIKMAVPTLKKNLKEKMVDEINNIKEEKKKEEQDEDEIEEIRKFLKDKGYDFEIVEEEND